MSSSFHSASSVLRTKSSSIWRDGLVEMFSNSSRVEDDEEALKWAAIEKLPTFDRLRKGLLKESLGEANEVDIKNLESLERKNLIDRLVRNPEEDNEKFLLKLKNRIDRVGIDVPSIEVRFENLNVEAKAFVGAEASHTFSSFCVNILKGFLRYFRVLPRGRKHFSILSDVSGIIKPCRMTLLLGPPSSGKTTLLLALSGKLDTDLKFSGNVTYNGHQMHEFVPQRTAAYISQHDLHNGEMTVRETLEFSASCQGIGSRYEMLEELSRRENAANIKPDPDVDIFMKAAATEGQEASIVTDYILKILGLESCADIIVGNAMLRGISGGQKKRVTAGEMLVGPAKALFMDEISTGLDTSTTFQIVKSLKQSAHILKGTALISLLQPAPETYDLFDDIILLSNGQIVYQGPREHVLTFFEFMGFKCPERKGVADFLQEVTSKKDQGQYWARKNVPYSFVTVSQFATAFKSFDAGQRLADELTIPFDKTKSHPAALTTKKYGASMKELFKACTSREILLIKRNSFVYTFKLLQLTIVALLSTTLFLRTEMYRNSVMDGRIYLGALFVSVTAIMFNGMSEIAMTVSKMSVFHKQRDLLFYPAWVYSIPSWVVKVPVSCIEVALFVSLTYYGIGFDPNVERHCLLLFLLNQSASGLYRFIAVSGRSMIIANAFGSFASRTLLALSGFVLSREDVKKWWLWGYWSSPLMYAQNAVAVNEFLGHSWRHVPENETEPLGILVLKSRGFFVESYWYWVGVGALLGFVILFNFCSTLALTYLKPLGNFKACVPEEDVSDGRNDRTGGSNLFSSHGNSSNKDTKIEGDVALTGRITSFEFLATGRGASVNANHKEKRGIVLPFEQHFITFEDIVYSIDMPQEMKDQGAVGDRLVLLNGLSGAFRPGVLSALMGVSGAGKTTLMDVLAGRKTGGYIEGNVLISGYPKKQETFARISGYCEQNDIHSPNVTVYESLLYSAWLRLPPEVNHETRKTFVEETMELVELTPLKEALVGLPGISGLSTEQRKRLTIAVELVANPSIIFMDEPTSGLDARAAAVVMRTVRNTVEMGRTIVCTIHQPSIDVFDSFDELFLMKRGGQEIYVGPLGLQSCQLIEYFEGIAGVPKIKDGYNPATWMLEVTNSAQELSLGLDFSDVYKNSDLYRRNKTLIAELSSPPPGSKDLYFSTQYSQSFFTQCMACLWKQHWSYWRNPHYTAIRFLFSAFAALLFGSIFWDLGSKMSRQQDLFNIMGSLYASVYLLGVMNASTVQPVVAVERTIFYRERAAGMYSSLPYTFAQVMIEVPHIFSQSIVYVVIFYAMVGLEWTVAKFFWNFFIMYFTFLYFTFYGMITVAVSPNQSVAATIATTLYAFWNYLSGFIVPRTRIPVWWRWMYWANPFALTIYGLIVSQFGDNKDLLDNNETVEEFLKSYFGFRHDFLGVIAVVLIGFTVLCAFMFALAIKVFNFQRR